MPLSLGENIWTVVAGFSASGGTTYFGSLKMLQGTIDKNVLAMARTEGRALFSFDRDHPDLIFGCGAAAPRAVVLLRVARPAPEHIKTLARVLALIGMDLLGVFFTVITLGGMRQRSLPTSP